MSQPGAAVIDRFVDALWIEDGLAPLTLAAYRGDLEQLARWIEVGTSYAASLPPK